MSFDVSSDPVDFDEAIAFFRQKLALTTDELDDVTTAASDRAFTIAGVAQLDVVQQVFDAIDKALKEGTPFDEFADAVSAPLERAWGGSVANPPWRIETIFRTNVQKAYSRGRVKQAREVVEDRPVWMFDAVLDDRTSDVCEECQGTVLPADDPWWSEHMPPLHFGCRSTFITLTEDQAAQFGVSTKGPSADADDGFGDLGVDDDGDDADDDGIEPDQDDYDAEVWAVFRSMFA